MTYSEGNGDGLDESEASRGGGEVSNKPLPHKGIPMPDDYVEQMRHYFPRVPFAFIRQAWNYNASVPEVRAYLSKTTAQEGPKP
jgi:hypothetical protein